MTAESIPSHASERALIIIDTTPQRIYAAGILSRSYNAAGPSTVDARVNRRIVAGTAVRIRFDSGSCADGSVEDCGEMLEGGFRAVLRLASGKDRRKEPRFPVSEPAQLTELRSAGPVPAIDVTTVDVSRSGLGILSAQLVLPGTRVEIALRSARIAGMVRNARPDQSNYRLGIAIASIL